jgi:hypothetical protein
MTIEPLTGLRLTIHRSAHDGSNGGVSSTRQNVTLIGIIDANVSRTTDGLGPRDRVNMMVLPAHAAGPFAPTEDAPAVVLIYRRMGHRRIEHVEPFEQAPRGSYMAGGTFVTGDSRFSDLVGFYGAVAFHDRSE